MTRSTTFKLIFGREWLPGILLYVFLGSIAALNLSCSSTTTSEPSMLSAALGCYLADPLLVIVNSGGPMKNNATVRIAYEDGTRDSMEILIPAHGSDTCRLSNIHGAPRVSIDGISGTIQGAECLGPLLNSSVGNINPHLPDPLMELDVLLCRYTVNLNNTDLGSQNVELTFTDPTKFHFNGTITDFTTGLDIVGSRLVCGEITGTLSFDEVRYECDVFVTEDDSGFVTLDIRNRTSSFSGFELTGNFAANVLNIFVSSMEDRIGNFLLDYTQTSLESLLPGRLRARSECQ